MAWRKRTRAPSSAGDEPQAHKSFFPNGSRGKKRRRSACSQRQVSPRARESSLRPGWMRQRPRQAQERRDRHACCSERGQRGAVLPRRHFQPTQPPRRLRGWRAHDDEFATTARSTVALTHRHRMPALLKRVLAGLVLLGHVLHHVLLVCLECAAPDLQDGENIWARYHPHTSSSFASRHSRSTW